MDLVSLAFSQEQQQDLSLNNDAMEVLKAGVKLLRILEENKVQT